MSNFLIKSLLVGTCLSAATVATAKPWHQDQHRAHPASGNQVTYARVVGVTPIYNRVEVSQPQTQCWNEQVEVRDRHRHSGSVTNEIVGGIVGGAIGNALGSNKGTKKVGAVVGAVLGASIANDLQPKYQQPVKYREVERCRQVTHTRYEQQLQGYDVTYRFQGRQYKTQLDYHPGDSLAVELEVRPLVARR